MSPLGTPRTTQAGGTSRRGVQDVDPCVTSKWVSGTATPSQKRRSSSSVEPPLLDCLSHKQRKEQLPSLPTSCLCTKAFQQPSLMLRTNVPRSKGSRARRPPTTTAGESKPEKAWPHPPKEVVDEKSKTWYVVGDMLGEGGFARVYHGTDEKGSEVAIKVMPKSVLRSSKIRSKLFSEINIHKTMRHRHIVRFHAVFEDTENVYMILEL
ncbi:kinase-like domain-containing protein, partial [Piptocephalis cylindrospora]